MATTTWTMTSTKNTELFREHRRQWEKVDIMGCTGRLDLLVRITLECNVHRMTIENNFLSNTRTRTRTSWIYLSYLRWQNSFRRVVQMIRTCRFYVFKRIGENTTGMAFKFMMMMSIIEIRRKMVLRPVFGPSLKLKKYVSHLSDS